MSTTYKVIAGDTYETVARIKYGTELEASRIAKANPGVSEPLSAGTIIVVPGLPGSPTNAQQNAPSETENEVALLIDGKRFRFWTGIRITRAMDNMDILEVSAPFEPEDPGVRETFRPFSFKPVTVLVGGAPLFTGTSVGVSPVQGEKQRTVGLSAYAKPGVLNDCTSPAASSQLEFDGQTLKGIAEELVAPFGVSVVFSADPGPVFERVMCATGRRVLDFLTELAQQRKQIISSTEAGEMLFQESVEAGSPVATLRQGSAPLISVSPFFNPQGYYSHITGVEPVIIGLDGAQYTVKNPRLLGVLRPLTFTAPDTEDADIKAAVEAKAGRMFGNMATYSVEVSTWRDPSGNIWAPNTSIILQAPGAMIYQDYEFIIRSVELNAKSDVQTATLNLVIPGSFRGKIPEVLPWDE